MAAFSVTFRQASGLAGSLGYRAVCQLGTVVAKLARNLFGFAVGLGESFYYRYLRGPDPYDTKANARKAEAHARWAARREAERRAAQRAEYEVGAKRELTISERAVENERVRQRLAEFDGYHRL